MTFRELVYIITDLSKTISDDSNFNQDHILFLACKYREYACGESSNVFIELFEMVSSKKAFNNIL